MHVLYVYVYVYMQVLRMCKGPGDDAKDTNQLCI